MGMATEGRRRRVSKLKKKDELEQELDEILSRNKDVDPDQLQEARAGIAELRKQGHRRPSYGLVPPYERRLLHSDPDKPAKHARPR